MPEPSEIDLTALLGRALVEHVPFNISVMDRDYRIIAANQNFESFFGDWRGRRCYEVYKRASEPCPGCNAQSTFDDGRPHVSDQTGFDRQGRTCHYVLHTAPLKDEKGNVKYIFKMTTDVTETRHWQREYDLFFERVPCYVMVVDRDFRIIRANEKFRKAFGEAEGRLCYSVCKRQNEPCPNCPAALTFEDGAEHTSSQVGVHSDGSPAYYVATSSPLSRGEAGVAHVIEMVTDITPVTELKEELERTHDLYSSLIRNSPAGILAVDMEGDARIMNRTARALLEWKSKVLPMAAQLKAMLPVEFSASGTNVGDRMDLPEGVLRSARGQEIPVHLSTVRLKTHGKEIGRAAFVEDLREIKRLEHEKLEAERMAAVGQTVAGLAHTIKNLLMGLEGGMFIVDSGLRRGDVGRITNGWAILQRNFDKTTSLVKDFLNFAKGRLPELRPTDPNALARGIVDLYRETARLQGVELLLEPGKDVHEAPLDPDGMETCLTNLLSNALDAAVMRDQPGGRVILRTRDEAGELVFEVIDNGCGMDWEVKGRVFTTFFTTKGGKGTGLGLLTTRKIVQEHGGRIEVESVPGSGSTFRIRLPRKRLQAIAESVSTTQLSADQVKP